jgi:hypothetical protein
VNLCPCSCHIEKKKWKEKIRRDYKGILSESQIEETIEYWEGVIEEAMESERAACNRAFDSMAKDIKEEAKKEERMKISN